MGNVRVAAGMLLVAGCAAVGPAPGSDGARDGGSGVGDDGGGGAADAAPRSPDCDPALPEAFGSPAGVEFVHAVGAANRTSYGDLAAAPTQRLYLELEAGRGTFAGGLETGTFPLTSADVDFQTCAACVFLSIEAAAGPWTLYMARAGTLRIT